jgi:hypothetical protein
MTDYLDRAAPIVLINNSTGQPYTASSDATVHGHAAQAVITRPNDTTDYTAGDAVGDTGGSAILTFADVSPAAGEIIITNVELMIAASAIPSGMAAFTLELYDAAPDAVADNAAWDLSSAGDRGKYLGSIALNTPTDKGSTLFSQNDDMDKKQVTVAGTDLYAVLRTDGAFTPAANTVFTVTVHTIDV